MTHQFWSRSLGLSLCLMGLYFAVNVRAYSDDRYAVTLPAKVMAWQDRTLGNALLPPQSPRIVRNNDHDEMRSGVRLGQYVPLSKVLKTIRQKYPGKQLNTRMLGGGNAGPVRYEVKWLTPDGHRLDITADAKTGRIINVRGL